MASEAVRLLVVHKQTTSARTRFLRFAHGMLAFAPLPALSVLREPEEASGKLAIHPAQPLRQAEQKLGLASSNLAVETAFHAWIDTPAGDVRILLVVCQSIDPPFAAAEAIGSRFIALTEARGLPPIEMQILRRAYEYIMG